MNNRDLTKLSFLADALVVQPWNYQSLTKAISGEKDSVEFKSALQCIRTQFEKYNHLTPSSWGPETIKYICVLLVRDDGEIEAARLIREALERIRPTKETNEVSDQKFYQDQYDAFDYAKFIVVKDAIEVANKDVPPKTPREPLIVRIPTTLSLVIDQVRKEKEETKPKLSTQTTSQLKREIASLKKLLERKQNLMKTGDHKDLQIKYPSQLFPGNVVRDVNEDGTAERLTVTSISENMPIEGNKVWNIHYKDSQDNLISTHVYGVEQLVVEKPYRTNQIALSDMISWEDDDDGCR